MIDPNSYKKDFSEKKFWQKLKNIGKHIGLKITYISLLLFYAYKRKETPQWAKNIVLGALGYLIAPFDFIPDLTPFLGLTDDLTVLSLGLSTIALHINEQVKLEAQQKLSDWFGEYPYEEIVEIEDELLK